MSQTPFNGNYLDAEGNVKNLLDLGEPPVDSPVKTMAPFSGNFIASDGSIHNIEELAAGGGSITSDLLWRPYVAYDGTLSWVRSSTTTPPETQNIQGPAGESFDPKDVERITILEEAFGEILGTLKSRLDGET